MEQDPHLPFFAHYLSINAALWGMPPLLSFTSFSDRILNFWACPPLQSVPLGSGMLFPWPPPSKGNSPVEQTKPNSVAGAPGKAMADPLAWRGEDRRARKREQMQCLSSPSHTGTCNLMLPGEEGPVPIPQVRNRFRVTCLRPSLGGR